MLEVTNYYPSNNRDHTGNPLVEVFPPLTEKAFGQLMTHGSGISEVERTHSVEQRLQYVYRLMDFYCPLDPQIDFAQKLWALMCASYKPRDPTKKRTTSAFNQLCREIATETVPACTTGHFRDSPWSAFVIGTPGTGKTTAPLALLQRIGKELLHHKNHGELYQLYYVHVQAPKKGSGKALAELVYNQLIEAAEGIDFPFPYRNKRPSSLGAFEGAIKALVEKLNLGVLILDELQHLYAGNGKMDEDAMKFLTGFVSRLGVPTLFVGTWECIPLLGIEIRSGRRGTTPTHAFFCRMKNDEDFDLFVREIMRDHQATKQLAQVDDAFVERVYFHTQGIQDLVIKLLVMTQVEAILAGIDMISAALIDEVANEHMQIISPAVRMLRDGRSEDDPAVWDLEPKDLDFNKYIAEYTANIRLTSPRRSAASPRLSHQKQASVKDQKAAAIIQAMVTSGEVAASLVATNQVSAEDARVLAAASVGKHPKFDAVEHVRSILEKKTKPGPKPTRSSNAKKQTEVEEAFASLDDDDVRKIVFLARVDCPAIAAALESAGHLCPILNDLAY